MTAMNTSPTPQQQGHVPAVGQSVVGVLLVHGLNGSRHDLAELAALLQNRGVIAENMLLPGHGTHVRDMLSLGWPEWAQAVRQELHRLKQRCGVVFLIGHSLGGRSVCILPHMRKLRV